MITASWIVVAMVVVAMIGFWGATRFNRELEKSSPVTWRELGSPKMFMARSFWAQLHWMGFIVAMRYRELNNPRLAFYGDWVLVCGVINIALLISWGLVPHGNAPTIG
jgi:hypothetical protein